MIFNGRTRITSGHRTVGRPQQSLKRQSSLEAEIRSNTEEDMAEDRYLWRLGVDGRLLAV